MNLYNTIYERYLTLQGTGSHRETERSLKRRRRQWSTHYGRHLPASRNARILELGCGDGAFLRFLGDLGYLNTAGVDVSPEQVQAARASGQNSIELGDLRDALRKSEGLDLVVALDVLEHFGKQDLFDVLSLCLSALRPGGGIIAQVPNGQGLFAGSVIHGDLTHEVALTQASAGQLLSAAGFEQVEVYSCGPVPAGLVSAMRWALWQFVQTGLRVAQASETGSLSGHFTRNIIVVARRGGAV